MHRMTPYALLTLLLLVGCHSGNTMDTLVGQSDLTQSILEVYGRITWWSVFLFILVQGLLIYAVLRFKVNGRTDEIPEQVHGHQTMEIVWTILPVFILIHIAVPTVQIIFDSQSPGKPDALVINSVGEQWWFSFDYPGLGVTTANEVHVPLGREVVIRLQSDNVIHSFWVPQITAKRDMVPGRVNQIKFTADKTGTYLGQCAEYCGDSHALMRFRMVVDTPEDFEKWVKAQAAPAVSEGPTAEAGFAAFQSAGCVTCHSIRGTSAMGVLGPDLTHVGSRQTIAAGIMDNTAENLTKWILDPADVKPGSKMTDLYPEDQEAQKMEQVKSIVAYLQSLK